MSFLRRLYARVREWSVETFKKTGVRQWSLAALVFITLGGILLANTVTERVDLAAGQVAAVDVEAPQRVVNQYRTDIMRAEVSDEAVKAALADDANYIINEAVEVQARERLAAAFNLFIDVVREREEKVALVQGDVRETLPDSSSNQETLSEETIGETSDEQEGTYAASVRDESLPVPEEIPAALPPIDLDVTLIEELQASYRDAFGVEFPRSLAETGLRLSSEELGALHSIAADFVGRLLNSERISEDDLDAVRDGLYERLMLEEGRLGSSTLTDDQVEFVAALVAPSLSANLILDLQSVNRAKEAALRNVTPQYVERGQIIVRKGDIVTEEHIQILQDLGMLGDRPNYGVAAGMLAIVAMTMALFGAYLYQHNRGILSEEGHLGLLGLLLVLVSGTVKLLSFFPSEVSGYLVPAALATMLIAILLDVHVAMMSAVFISVVVALVMGPELKFGVVTLISGLAGVFSVNRVGERTDLTRAGLIVGLVTFVSMVAFGLFSQDRLMVQYSFLGVINGLVSAILSIGLFPYLESVFGITSSIRLLELSNPNQPLLRKLLMEAPGTYHHSMIVGNLAEAAAEAIGGDPLLTRVGAQYHDIGKTKRPYFFIENQYGGDNPHDKISPSLSTLILTSHVKDGVELARQYKLPEVVIDFIRQHHGTTLVKYFYQKALENANAKEEECDEKDYRYPGPIPQSKETAVVLLADSVEAAVRTLRQPTPGRIEGLVRKIVKDHLADGQLDESDITLRDLDKICDAFVKVLTGIFHKRVDYPENVLQEMEAKRA